MCKTDKLCLVIWVIAVLCLWGCHPSSSFSQAGTSESCTEASISSAAVSSELLDVPEIQQGVYDVTRFFEEGMVVFYENGLWLRRNYDEDTITFFSFDPEQPAAGPTSDITAPFGNLSMQSAMRMSGKRLYKWCSFLDELHVYDLEQGSVQAFQGDRKYTAFCPDPKTGGALLVGNQGEQQQFYRLDTNLKEEPWFTVGYEDVAFFTEMALGEKGIAFSGGAFKEMGQQSQHCYGFLDFQGEVSNKVFRGVMDAVPYQNGLLIYDGPLMRGEGTYALGRFLFLDADTLSISEFEPNNPVECQGPPALSDDGKFLLTTVEICNDNGERAGYTFRVYSLDTGEQLAQYELARPLYNMKVSFFSSSRFFLITFHDETEETYEWKTYLFQF